MAGLRVATAGTLDGLEAQLIDRSRHTSPSRRQAVDQAEYRRQTSSALSAHYSS